MPEFDNFTALVVNYKTLDIITCCIKQLRHFYPKIKLIIVDNSNYDDSSKWVYKFASYDKNTTCLFNTYNIHHGPSMDIGIKLARTPFIFIIDSDVFIHKENIIEDMYAEVEEAKEWLAVGWMRHVNSGGTDITPGHPTGFPYISPQCTIINKATYLQYPSYKKHGSPCIDTMVEVNKQQKTHLLKHFDWKPYANHMGAATMKRFGLQI